MAPVVASKTAIARGNNSRTDQSDGKSKDSGTSRCNNSNGGRQSTRNQAGIVRDKSRALPTTTICNHSQTHLSKHTSISSSTKSSAIKSQTEAALKSAFPLPSTKLHKHKQAPVFTSGKKKHKTNFSSAYDSGSIPCRINHGSIRNSLQWTKDPNSLSFDPLLITCIEGFLETEHPFVFLARATFRELMKLEHARDKTLPILAQVIVPLRVALMAKDNDTFITALEATRVLSDLMEGEMNTHLSKLAQQIHRKLSTKHLRAEVEETLAVLENNGGNEALAIIHAKIPTYISNR